MLDPVVMLRGRLEGRSLRQMAKVIKVSPLNLSYVLRRKRPPGPKILAWLGVRKVTPEPIYEFDTKKAKDNG